MGLLRRSNINFNQTDAQTNANTSLLTSKIMESIPNFRNSSYKPKEEFIQTKKKFFNARGYSVENSKPTPSQPDVLKSSYHMTLNNGKPNTTRVESNNSIKYINSEPKRSQSNMKVPKNQDIEYAKLRDRMSSRNNFMNQTKTSFIFASNGYITTTGNEKITKPEMSNCSSEKLKISRYVKNNSNQYIKAYRRCDNRGSFVKFEDKKNSIDFFSRRGESNSKLKFPKSEKKENNEKNNTENLLKVSKSFIQNQKFYDGEYTL